MSSIGHPTSREILGPFNNVTYIRYRGQFRGETGNNEEYSVPYEITVPQTVNEGEQLFVFEPPHLTSGLVARDTLLGERFLFERGYSHASCGFGNRARHILDPNPPFNLKIRGNPIRVIPPDSTETEVVDYRIVRQFVAELRRSVSPLFGPVRHVIGVGFSDSGRTIHEMYKSFGHKSFDLTVAGTANYVAPIGVEDQRPIMVVNTEADFDARAIPNPAFPAYRYYDLTGAPHIPDAKLTRGVFNGKTLPGIAGTTPINWLPFARALFKAGDAWIRNGKQPPPSATFQLGPNGEILRDDRQNALGGIRHPALQLREARFIASLDRNGWDLFGDYRDPRQLTAAEFPEYVRSFKRATDALFDAGYLLDRGRDRLHRQCQLKPNNTFTLNYRDGLVVRS